MREDELPLRASSLTFISLFSLAPILAFVFTIFKGMGKSQEVISKLEDSMEGMPEQVQAFFDRMIEYVNNSSSLGIGGVAIVVLLFMVIKVMSDIEYAFNRVWGVRKARTLLRKFSDFISTLVLVSMLILAIPTVTGLSSVPFAEKYLDWSKFSEAYEWIFKLGLVWVGFSILYLIMPNTRVRFKPAVYAGLIGALLWLGWQWLYLHFQGMIIQQPDKIFGAFATVPIFMVWLYVCWIIILFGAEVSFAIQNYKSYHLDNKASETSARARTQLALAIVSQSGMAMDEGQKLFDADAYGDKHAIPTSLMNETLNMLVQDGFIVELAEHQGCYTLARSPDKLTIQEIISAVEEHGENPDFQETDPVNLRINAVIHNIQDAREQTLAKATIRDLIEGQPS